MKAFGKITLKGASGASYRFRVHPWEAEFGSIGAVYVVTKRKDKAGGKHAHSRIYAGQTGDLSSSVATHRKTAEFETRKANCVCVLCESAEARRREIESDLMSLYRPPCNASA